MGKILDYEKESHLLTIQYKDKSPFVLLSDSFLGCNFIRYIGYRKINWKYNIGDRLYNDKRDITIINRKVERKENGYIKKYQYSCNKCGFNCGEHYYYGDRKDDYALDVGRKLGYRIIIEPFDENNKSLKKEKDINVIKNCTKIVLVVEVTNHYA